MPNLEWEVPHTLASRGGSLDLNVTDAITLRRFQILPDTYEMAPALRTTTDNTPREDGQIALPRYKTGVLTTLRISFWVMSSTDPNDVSLSSYACEADLCEMYEQLIQIVDELRYLDDSVDFEAENRLLWTPSCSDGTSGARRMLTSIGVESWPKVGRAEPNESYVDLVFDCPWPYATDEFFTTTPLPVGTTVVDNVGTTRAWGTLLIPGPFTTCSIQNVTTGEEFNYDGGQEGADGVGGGEYLAVDMYTGSVVRSDGADMAAGVVASTSSFWQLVLGSNSITVDHAATLHWSPAWA